MKESYFSDRDNWKKINKQCIYEAHLPYVPERPFLYFILEHGSDTKGFLSKELGESSKNSELLIVNTLKRRKVLVLSSDDLNHNTVQPDILVAKITSIKEHEKTQNFYKLIKNDQHPTYVYLPKSITGEECYVDLTSVTTIAKNLLLEYKAFLPPDRMEEVEKVFQDCLDLGIVKKNMESAI